MKSFPLQLITSGCELNHKPMLVWMVELLVSPLLQNRGYTVVEAADGAAAVAARD